VSKTSEKAYFAIRDMILEGVVRPGDRLSEEQLSAAIGVSRTPIRDALRRLESDYFVSIRANRGARVRGWDAADIADLFQLRAIIEGFAARRAAERASPEQIAELRAQIKRIDDALASGRKPDIELFLAANARFHQVICDASGNSRLADMISALVAQAVVVRTARGFSVEDLQRSNFHHREMVEAIEARDGDLAETVMKTHILSAGNSFKQIYDGSGAPAARNPSPSRPVRR